MKSCSHEKAVRIILGEAVSVYAKRILGRSYEDTENLCVETDSGDASSLSQDNFHVDSDASTEEEPHINQLYSQDLIKALFRLKIIRAHIKRKSIKSSLPKNWQKRMFVYSINNSHHPIITDGEGRIVLIDQPVVMLYHEHVQQYALHIDATASLIRNLRRFKKILLYTATVQHPFAKSPPLPVAEYITTKQNQHSVKRFLGALVEMETLKYGKATFLNRN